MGLIPASYYLRRAADAEDLQTALQFYAYFYKHMWNSAYFTMKSYDDAWKKYLQNFTSVAQR